MKIQPFGNRREQINPKDKQIQFKSIDSMEGDMVKLVSKNEQKKITNIQKKQQLANQLQIKYKQALNVRKNTSHSLAMKVPKLKVSSCNPQSEQRERFQKLGLQQFLFSPIKPTNESHQIRQKIIKNLNYTYFRSTQNINVTGKHLVNTLGIKRNSVDNGCKVDWGKKGKQNLDQGFQQIGYLPNRLFPCRKNQTTSNKFYAKRNSTAQLNNSRDKINPKSISDIEIIPNNDKISLRLSNQRLRSMQKSKLNQFSQLFMSRKISRPKTSTSTCRPISELRCRQSYSSNRNRRQSEDSSPRQQIMRRKQSCRSKNIQINSISNLIIFENDKIQQNEKSDFIVGKRMQIHL